MSWCCRCLLFIFPVNRSFQIRMSKISLCLRARHVLAMSQQCNLLRRVHCSFSTTAVNSHRIRNRPSIAVKNDQQKIDNPGFGRRLKIIKEDVPDVDSVEITDEDIEELEGDFLNARHMREQHFRDLEQIRHRTELKITERKHFKPAIEPNMLTWSDKEQIRYLHKQDPVVWNVDKLSESFPATPTIIKKVIKSCWQPESYERMRRHDEIVSSNWEAFCKDKLLINCPLLKEHLKKFTKRRSLSFCSGVPEKSEQLPKPKGSEFVDIIQSYKLPSTGEKHSLPCKRIENDSEPNDSEEVKYFDKVKQYKNEGMIEKECSKLEASSYQGRNSLPVFVDNRSHYTLEKLRGVIKKKQSDSDLKCLNEQDRVLLKGIQSESSVMGKESNAMGTLTVNSYDDVDGQFQITSSTTEVSDVKEAYGVVNKDSANNLPVTKIARRIHIPKSKLKIGCLYKVNDCFYSHDGIFLYRVPGMVSENS